ncbi:DUF4157 domain-containing protein [uncultured Winogradskyella sp.]|uniref:eCIS core domain-containing protein n=1 Tax=uncultured Winogradskyella sp. TaxID=395353 RepID=UPI0026346EE8|nr:DUF4157 domain-containing protein [uncultured Winogradskyella sp.]
MLTYIDRRESNSSRSTANAIPKEGSTNYPTFQLVDNRPEASVQRKQVEAMADHTTEFTVQKKPNNTGLPDNLKSGIENLSGLDMSDTKVHYNSNKPAQLNAHAYAQGTNIHLASGQEKHLPHEAWHVVQQKQGRVKPTLQMKGKAYINDDAGLEREADVMGAKSLQMSSDSSNTDLKYNTISSSQTSLPVQRAIGFEFQAYNSVTYRNAPAITPIPLGAGHDVGNGAGFTVEEDSGATNNEVEIVTDPVPETPAGRLALIGVMADITALAGAIANGVVVNGVAAGGVAWLPRIAGFHFHVPGAVHFHPQATVGVKFEKIGELIDYLTAAPNLTGGAVLPGAPALGAPADAKAGFAQQIGWSGQADQIPFQASYTQGLADARNNLAGASDEAIGFAAMLYGLADYTNSGNHPADAGFMKYFMPFMPRLGLLQMYNNLQPADILALANIPAAVRGTMIIPDDAEMMMFGNNPTIDDLLNAFAGGQDIQHIVNWAPQSYAQGNVVGMAGPNDIGPAAGEPARNGAILELRKLGNDVTPAQLGPFALAVFDLVRAINAPPVAPVGGGVAAGGPPPGGPPPGGGGGAPAGGGGNNNRCCFLTTACCEYMGLADDCEELTTLRWFRDNYLLKKADGKELVSTYYKVAPVIVDGMNKHPFKDKILKSLYTIIKKCVDDIKKGDFEEAQLCYTTVTLLLSKSFFEEH